MSKSSLIRAVDIVGGQQALADAINAQFKPEDGVKITQTHVWKWLNTTKDGVSEKMVLPVAKATKWEVTPHELRDDLYPYPEDGLPPEIRAEKGQLFGRRAEDRPN